MNDRSGAPPGASPLEQTICGISFQNPMVLSSGTVAYGREVADVISLEKIGGLVTKAVSLEPRNGAAAPRVTEFAGGMLNAIGLANPGVAGVRTDHLPWIAKNLDACRVIVNVVGFEVDHFARVVSQLENDDGFEAFELNLSCPNTKAGGLEFGADKASLQSVISLARRETRRPLLVKLSPTLVDIAASAQAAQDAGADAVTLVNTIPGMLIDIENRAPILGFGSGGVSGAALLPVGVLATAKVARAVKIPIVGVGGISTAQHALQYMIAGASLTGIGTATLRDPRTAERVVEGLQEWCDREGVGSIASVVGTLKWK